MFLKVHRSPGMPEVVAVCDRELLNTTLRHGDMVITVSEAFYGSSPATDDDVKAALRQASNVNLMGERCVNVAISMGLLDKSGCIMIGSVPHAQIFQL